MKPRKYRFLMINNSVFYTTIDKIYKNYWIENKETIVSYEEHVKNDLCEISMRRWIQSDCNTCLNNRNIITFNLVKDE